jgi:lipopolysaccharide export system protein LptC
MVLAALLGCGGNGEVENPAADTAYPEQETEAYHTRQTRAGVAVWELWGDRAENTAEVDQQTEFTTARGNVVVVNQDGDQLESEVLHWNPNEQLIHTEEFVRFTRGDQILTGYGMDTDPDLTNVNIHRQFEGDLPANQEPVDGEGR